MKKTFIAWLKSNDIKMDKNKKDNFELIVTKLIVKHCNENNLTIDEFNKNNDFGYLKIQLLLFFVTQASIHRKLNGFPNDGDLIDIFDIWINYPYGILEKDIMKNIKSLSFKSFQIYKDRTIIDENVIHQFNYTMDESINRLFSLNEELTSYPLIELVDISDNYNIREKYKRIGNCSDVRNLDFFMETNRVFKGNTMELF